ncbi:glycosyltransferase family 4 protein [Methanococcoides seepicolus]|uniref:Glycosyltransferase family 4 protein n=1 Tax=Methanococcoides seepicolus TaxID=2828780 RepID=A0A9E4ZGL6_9EURY|nr:glycosyltransferase family 4 protein [Methanococcoides seepicolus]MCM1987211.1 glycosyltransferase family 4 protein [Methanococcoides seepicolus]
MRILMLNYEYPPLGGGASPVTKSLSEELVRLGHTVDVVTMGYKELKPKEDINGVTVYRVPSIRKKLEVCQTHEMLSYCISAYRFLPKLLETNQYDIVHTHFIIPTGVLSYLSRKSIPYIITSHGSDVPGYNPDRFGLQHKLLKPLWNTIVKNAACITSPTNYHKNLILENITNKEHWNKVKVIPNGIHPGNFVPKNKERKILVVTRLFERKGVQYVIEAMKDIKNYSLVICGDGPYKKQLEMQISRLNVDNIDLLGYVSYDRLKHEYETSSIFVFPSSSESFGLVLLEAMSAGCATITSNATGCPEVVGDTALLIRTKNSEDIRKALVKLINDDQLRIELGLKAKKRVEDSFTWKKIAKQYLSVYEDVIHE